jgi:hypothetical protein
MAEGEKESRLKREEQWASERAGIEARARRAEETAREWEQEAERARERLEEIKEEKIKIERRMECIGEDLEIMSYQKEQEEITMGKVLDEKLALIDVLRA